MKTIEARAKMTAAHTNPSPETTAKRSASLRGNKNGLGYKFTDEQRRKSGAAKLGNSYALGFKHSEATLAKRRGRTVSDATKAKMAAAHRRRCAERRAQAEQVL